MYFVKELPTEQRSGRIRAYWLERGRGGAQLPPCTIAFRFLNSAPEVIHLTMLPYIRYPLSLRQVEDLLFDRGIDICHETVWL